MDQMPSIELPAWLLVYIPVIPFLIGGLKKTPAGKFLSEKGLTFWLNVALGVTFALLARPEGAAVLEAVTAGILLAMVSSKLRDQVKGVDEAVARTMLLPLLAAGLVLGGCRGVWMSPERARQYDELVNFADELDVRQAAGQMECEAALAQIRILLHEFQDARDGIAPPEEAEAAPPREFGTHLGGPPPDS